MATFIGNGRANVIEGTDAADLIDGRGGNDTLVGRRGNDRLLGGAGDDQALGLEGRDELRGGAGDDFLGDLHGRNRVFGEAGDDVLSASGVVDGGSGDDRIEVFFRGSLLTGGEGADTFDFGILFGPMPVPGTLDTVTDFDRGEGDRLDVTFGVDGTGLDAVAFVGRGPFTGDAQVRYEVRDGDTLVFVNNVDTEGEPVGTPDFALRLDGAFHLTEDDFLLA